MQILNILLPKIFPTTISSLLCFIKCKQVISSGIEVAKATSVTLNNIKGTFMGVNATINSGDLIEFNISGDSVLSGKVSYYSLHCSGCGGNLGSGAALDGVFYNDPTYGYVRAMACGREYPYGTVVSISGTPLGDFNGICLDRGGMIGTSKKRVFDILVNSNEEAYQYGISNITYNVIRNGY